MLGADLETGTRSLGREACSQAAMRVVEYWSWSRIEVPPQGSSSPRGGPIVSAYQLLGEIPHTVTHSESSCVLCRAVAEIISRE